MYDGIVMHNNYCGGFSFFFFLMLYCVATICQPACFYWILWQLINWRENKKGYEMNENFIFFLVFFVPLLLKYIKIIHSISFCMIGSSFHCSKRNHTICSWVPYCSWETHRGSLDRHHSVSCPRAGRTLLSSLWIFCQGNSGLN